MDAQINVPPGLQTQEAGSPSDKDGLLLYREQRKPVELFINSRSRSLGYDESKPVPMIPYRAPTASSPNPSAFLRLPLEIRLKILEIAISHGRLFPIGPITVKRTSKWNLKSRKPEILGDSTTYQIGAVVGPASREVEAKGKAVALDALRLAQTCSQLYYEVIVDYALFYSTNTFQFSTPATWLEWASSVSDETLGRLHKIHIADTERKWGAEKRYDVAFGLMARKCHNLRELQLEFRISDPADESSMLEPVHEADLLPLMAMKGLRTFELNGVPDQRNGGWSPPYTIWDPLGTWEDLLQGSEFWQRLNDEVDDEAVVLGEVVRRYGMDPLTYHNLELSIREEVLKPKGSK